MSFPLDAREVLLHLNEMGYRRVTSDQLKEFIQDLRKLIKYEERVGVNKGLKEESADKRYELLHKTSTASYRAKMKNSNLLDNPCPKSEVQCKFVNNKTTLQKKAKEARQDKIKEQQVGKSDHILTKNKLSKMWIRPRSVASSTGFCKSNDPVQLYQFYSEEWKKFKNNLPGENDHTDLRWNIRQKLLGA